jgi:hypothetical protein
MSTSFPIVVIAVGYCLIFVWHAFLVVQVMDRQVVEWKVLIQNLIVETGEVLKVSCLGQLSFVR